MIMNVSNGQSLQRFFSKSDQNSHRLSLIMRKNSETFNWDGIDFPTPIKQIDKFEKNNKQIKISVFGFDSENE